MKTPLKLSGNMRVIDIDRSTGECVVPETTSETSREPSKFTAFYSNPSPVRAVELAIADYKALAAPVMMPGELWDQLHAARNLLNSHADLVAALESSFAALDQARVFIADNLTTRAASDELVASWPAQNQARAALVAAKGVQS